MKEISLTVTTLALMLVIVFVIPVSSQSINYIEVNGTTFTQPEPINITCWSDNSSSETYLWNNYTGIIKSMFPNGTGVQTNITDSSNLKPGDYRVYCNSTWNSTLAWKTFSVISATTTTITTTVQETTTIIETTSSTTLPKTIEDKEPPSWSNLMHNPSVVKESDSVNIIVEWYDNVGLETVIIFENSTGSWKEHVCDKTTGQCSLGISHLSLIFTDLTSSFLIFVIPFTFIISLFGIGHKPKILLAFLSIVIFIFFLSIFLYPEVSRNFSRALSRLGIIPIGPIKTFSHNIPASELNVDEVVFYYSYANDTSGNENKTEIKSFKVRPVEFVPGEIETVSAKEEQEEASIDKPVKWRKTLLIINPSIEEVKGYKTPDLPKDAENVIVKDESGRILYRDEISWKTDIAGKENISYFVEYETPAPYKEESEIKPFVPGKIYRKIINIKSDFSGHYQNVKVYTDIPEELFKQNYKIRLYRIVDNSKIDITYNPSYGVKFLDSDSDGINDRMEWIVPQLSEEGFEVEASITIINVQSYPTVWGNWTVRFNTTGIADLIITPINNTNFDVDIQFLELKCGNEKFNPVYDGKSVFYANWSCSEEGRIINKVLKEGKHTLEFRFGDDVEYAFNKAGYDFRYDETMINTQTGTSWADMISMSFQPDTTDNYTIIVYAEVRGSSTSTDITTNLEVDGTVYSSQMFEMKDTAADWNAFTGVVRLELSNTQTHVIKIRFVADTGTAYARNARLMAWSVPVEQEITSESDSTWNSNTAWQDKVTLTWTPITTGNRLFIWHAEIEASSTATSTESRMYYDTGSTQWGYTEHERENAGNTWTFAGFKRIELTAAQQYSVSIDYRTEGTGNTARIRRTRIYVINLDELGLGITNYYNEVETSASMPTTWTDKVTNTYTPNVGDHLIMGTIMIGSISTSVSGGSRTRLDQTTEIASHWCEDQDTGDRWEYMTFIKVPLSAKQYTDDIQVQRETAGGQAAYARLIAIDLLTPFKISFNITLPGLSPNESSETQPGTLTTPIEFNASNPTESNVQPCVVGYSCASGYKQDASTPIFNFKNTGDVAEQWNISLTESLSSYGITLYGNTSSNPTLQEINTSGWIVSNNIPVGSSVQVWLYVDFVDSPAGTVGNIYINHTSLKA
jgi:hypothetical protein